MGYEVRVVVGDQSEHAGSNDSFYLRVLAVIELGNPGYGSDIYELCQVEDGNLVYFYGWDGTTQIFEDSYEKPLVALCPEAVRDALKRDYKDTGYTMFKVAADAIGTLLKTWGGDIVVTLYGH
jgi:hypothetical protein